MGKLRGGLKRIGAAFGAVGAAGVAGLAAATKKAIDYGDEIDKAAKRTGIGAEALQRYQLAADLSGASLQDLEKATKRSASVILDAQNGLMESKRALDDLGLSADDLAKKTPEQQLNAFLNALAGVENHSKRAALAQDIFGRAGTNLLPIIDGGSKAFRELMTEADRFNTILSQDQVTAAANAKDAMTRLQASLKALGFGAILTDGNSLADLLNTLAGRVAEFTESGGMRTLNDSLQSLASILKVVFALLKGIFEFGAAITKGGENLISGLGLTKAGIATNQLAAGTNQFGAASTSDLVLARMEMMMQNGVRVRPAGGQL
jgi:hypothetical protein